MHPYARNTHQKRTHVYIHTDMHAFMHKHAERNVYARIHYVRTNEHVRAHAHHTQGMCAHVLILARIHTFAQTRTPNTPVMCASMLKHARMYPYMHARHMQCLCSQTPAHTCTRTRTHARHMQCLCSRKFQHTHAHVRAHTHAASSAFGARYGRHGRYEVLTSEETPLRRTASSVPLRISHRCYFVKHFA